MPKYYNRFLENAMHGLSFDILTMLHNLAGFFLPDPAQPLVFSSGLFWVMFIIFLPVYATLRYRRTQLLLFVVAFSLFFFFKSSGWYFLLMVATAWIDWRLAQFIAHSDNALHRKWALLASLAGSLGVLVAFKYTNFFMQTWSALVRGNFQPWDIVAPIGLSFYTFRTVSYVVDVYCQRMEPTRSYLKYLFFLSFFPCLIAGPIVRARDFLPQVKPHIHVSEEQIYGGFLRVMVGVVKKAVVADYLAQYTSIVFGNPVGYSGFEQLMATLGFTMQLYCDFSGYSDMAIGIGSIMGFNLGENFNFPYRSRNITEFWRRWHISLSFWLRDYIYIPLGGNRKGRARQLCFLMVTMLLGGLWHGAAMSFVAWGGLHGAALCVHKMCQPRLKRIPDTLPVVLLSWMLNFAVVSLLWIFFAASSFNDAWVMIAGIFTNFDLAYFAPFVKARYVWCIMIVLVSLAHFVPRDVYRVGKQWFVGSHWIFKLAMFIIVVQLVIDFSSAEVKPFIYAQF